MCVLGTCATASSFAAARRAGIKKSRGGYHGCALRARRPDRERLSPLSHGSHRPPAVAAPTRAVALQALLVLSCLVPLLVLAMASWRSWYFERAEAADGAASTIGLVEEHVRKVLDTQVLVLNWIADRT